MLVRDQLIQQIFSSSTFDFEQLAIQVFVYQAEHNPLYNEYIKLLNINVNQVKKLTQIPFLPIQFFKTHEVKTGTWEAETVFTSSGTTSSTTSKHYVRSLELYDKTTVLGFESQYGPIEDFAIFALLPSYLERKGSSLVRMADHFIKKSKYEESGFYLDDYPGLIDELLKCTTRQIPVLLLGVSFALLELGELHPTNLANINIMETGGMKGRRKELTRAELHQQLSKYFHLQKINSEYGMTELMSQFYSKGDGIFNSSPTMRMLVRDVTDPFSYVKNSKAGAINIIDLSNIDSCSFIATDDLGRKKEDDSFEVLGRVDQSDIRGCNLLVAYS